MKRLSIALSLLAAFFLGQSSEAAAPSRLFFPIVVAQTNEPLLLVAHDCGLVNAVATPDGRVFVAYQTRPDGHIHIAEDVGDRLVDIVPAVPEIAVAPQFDLPGPKQGSVSQVVMPGGALRIYYTGRAEDDPTGPFYVWRLTILIPVGAP